MTCFKPIPCIKLVVTGISLAVLSGCASVNFDQSIAKTNQDAADFTAGRLTLAQTNTQKETSERSAAELLKRPLGAYSGERDH